MSKNRKQPLKKTLRSNPHNNYFKLPQWYIDWMPYMVPSEKDILVYIMRHTWGFHDNEKTITTDEFQYGRKRKDGTRLDEGTGLSPMSIRNGIKSAIEHGHIEVQVDKTDAARVIKRYSLVIDSHFEEFSNDDTPTAKIEHPDRQNLAIDSIKFSDRSEKETYKKEKELRSNVVKTTLKPRTTCMARRSVRKGCVVTDDDERFARQLIKILALYRSPLVRKTPRRKAVSLETIANIFSEIRQDYSPQEIQEVLAWMVDNYKSKYTPKIYRIDELSDFGRWVSAMERSLGKTSDVSQEEFDAMIKGMMKGKGNGR